MEKPDEEKNNMEKENKFLVKTKQKINPKKSNSAKVKSLKEKYRNSANLYLYSNPTDKISLDDEEEESVSSDKESDNSDSNGYLSPPVVTKKKNSKIMPEITPLKEDLFTKTIIAFLIDEDIQINTKSGKNNNSISKYKINKKILILLNFF